MVGQMLMHRLRIGLLLSLVGIAAGKASPNPGGTAEIPWKPDRITIADLESRLILPEGAMAMARYTRYYSGLETRNGLIIVARFVAGEDKAIVVDAEADLPGEFDGGCGIINIKYVVRRHRFIEVFCNGVA